MISTNDHACFVACLSSWCSSILVFISLFMILHYSLILYFFWINQVITTRILWIRHKNWLVNLYIKRIWQITYTYWDSSTTIFFASSLVQHECIPQAILGMDVICQAKSGMGKTAVFVLSTLQQIDPVAGQVAALVLCHTRELAYQVWLH